MNSPKTLAFSKAEAGQMKKHDPPESAGSGPGLALPPLCRIMSSVNYIIDGCLIHPTVYEFFKSISPINKRII